SCSSTSSSSNESCAIDPPREGLYYVLVHAFTSFSNLSLQASFTAPDATIIFTDDFESGDASAWSTTVP
ncbi:MAG: aminopeptidase, partial [Rhodospirillales bacterium]|nr:aminopeptidase [Rhodospirillales bacterium]